MRVSHTSRRIVVALCLAALLLAALAPVGAGHLVAVLVAVSGPGVTVVTHAAPPGDDDACPSSPPARTSSPRAPPLA